MNQSEVDSALPFTGSNDGRYHPVRTSASLTTCADLHITSNGRYITEHYSSKYRRTKYKHWFTLQGRLDT
jgi:hypothetical protein